ncbi:hypothetical protein [Psychromonas sp. SP041]|uniref:hypothetical protein n=1 Tax=Psychromonas sp. SP041 TaxID=1365007 RepID=UPI000418B7C3|nr:hypothetical protein [Psychromonas sp. SP041]
MSFKDMALSFSSMVADDAMLFGMSDEREKALLRFVAFLNEEGEEIPVSIKELLTGEDKPEDAHQQVSDTSGDFIYIINSVEATISFLLKINSNSWGKANSIAREEIEKHFTDTEWAFQGGLMLKEMAIEEGPLSLIEKLKKRPKYFMVSFKANNFKAFDGDSEEEVLNKLYSLKEAEFEILRGIFGITLTLDLITDESDIVVIPD